MADAPVDLSSFRSVVGFAGGRRNRLVIIAVAGLGYRHRIYDWQMELITPGHHPGDTIGTGGSGTVPHSPYTPPKYAFLRDEVHYWHESYQFEMDPPPWSSYAAINFRHMDRDHPGTAGSTFTFAFRYRNDPKWITELEGVSRDGIILVDVYDDAPTDAALVDHMGGLPAVTSWGSADALRDGIRLPGHAPIHRVETPIVVRDAFDEISTLHIPPSGAPSFEEVPA